MVEGAHSPELSEAKRLTERFPVLARLGRALHAPEIPEIRQTMATDCGAASLAMVLGSLGRHVALDELRTAMAIGRDGVSARAIVETSALYGLRGRGVRIELEDLAEVPSGSILHWNFSHFLVFEGMRGEDVAVIDPAFGRRVVPREEARKAFTGVALLFEKDELFVKSPKPGTALRRHVTMLFAGDRDWGRIALLSLFLQGLALLLPLFNGRLVDRVIPRNDTHLLAVLGIGFLLTVVFHFLATMTRSQLLLHLRTRFDAKLTMGFVEHMMRLPYDFFERRQVADLQMRVGSVATIREVLSGAVLSGVIDGTLVVVHLVFVCCMSLRMAGLALLLVAVQASVFLISRKRLQQLSASTISKQTDAQNALNELLSGMESLKASGVEHGASQRWASHYVDLLNIGLRRGGTASLSEAMLGTLAIVGPMALLLAGILEVMAQRMTLGTMLSAEAFAVGFIQPTMSLVGTLQKLQTVKVQLERIDDVLKTAPEQDADKPVRAAPKFRGEISLDRVSFRYGPKTPLVVREVSVKVRAGECIAIVGRSGSGKTTLGRLLLGLYQPTEGAVRIDGMPLGAFDLRSVRRQLGVVVQRPHVFGTTLRANIALADSSIPLARIQEAAKAACIHEDIVKMPMQYDTPVVAGGSSLSGGQRQRVALARALVSDPSVLLLDEATSALDAVTESVVQKNLQALSCTRIFIAHRLSTVVSADRILVMHEGALVEQGTHAELLAKGGYYAKLVRAQLGGLGEGAEPVLAKPEKPAAKPLLDQPAAAKPVAREASVARALPLTPAPTAPAPSPEAAPAAPVLQPAPFGPVASVRLEAQQPPSSVRDDLPTRPSIPAFERPAAAQGGRPSAKASHPKKPSKAHESAQVSAPRMPFVPRKPSSPRAPSAPLGGRAGAMPSAGALLDSAGGGMRALPLPQGRDFDDLPTFPGQSRLRTEITEGLPAFELESGPSSHAHAATLRFRRTS